jgi:cyclopropane-fatty-acyl-phospholipid synthase
VSLIDRAARALVLRGFAGLRHGSLVIRDGEDMATFGERVGVAATPAEPGAAAGRGRGPGALAVTLSIHDPRFYLAVLLGGHLGAAEAYLDGWWTTDDLTALMQLFVRNRPLADGMERGWVALARPARRAWHALRRNTRRGSRRNIAAHYDLGNDFFAEFLDETLTYSCGVFEQPDSTLRQASDAKYDRICRKLQLSARDHVLEIGAGWGGFALHAAGRYGCRVTTTTISRAQHAHATQRVAAAGLADRVTVLARDYRDLTGTFDKLVSIEMIEAVGHHYYTAFFGKCASLLRRGGAMALQAITIADARYERARREVDFIKRYVFPGSCIPSLAALKDAWARAGDLRLVDVEDITSHYVTTLRRWRENFVAHWDRIRALGFREEFRRLWEFYFCYCEGGFQERVLGDLQIVLEKPTT